MPENIYILSLKITGFYEQIIISTQFITIKKINNEKPRKTRNIWKGDKL